MKFSRREFLITETDKQQIIRYYQDGLSCLAISKIMPYCHDTIWKTLKSEGVVTSRRTIDRLSEEEIQDICNMYSIKIPTQKILNKYSDKI